MNEKEIKIYTSRMFKDGKLVTSEDSKEEVVEVVRLNPEVPYATISASLKSNVNLGNYQSVSFDVFMSVPCPMDVSGQQQEEAFKYCSDFCKAKIASLRKEVSGG